MAETTAKTMAEEPGSGRGEGGGLKRFALALCLVAGLQTAALAWMIYDRIMLIETGREITLNTIPVDPRSLFRGDYVILNYEISRLELKALQGDIDFEPDRAVFVTLQKSADATWQPVSIVKSLPATAGEDRIVLRGTVRSAGMTLRITYGIESYFVPEGEGKRLEDLVRERKLQVLLAVAPDGEAAIKGLLIDGELQYEEPLF